MLAQAAENVDPHKSANVAFAGIVTSHRDWGNQKGRHPMISGLFVKRSVASCALLGILVCAGGCPPSREKMLETTAKDWCLTISASQVIPVYPLTEDIQ